MSRLTLNARGQRLPLVATLVFASLLAALLAYGMRRASQLQAASSALQAAATLAPQPQLLTAQLTLIQRGLESATFIGDALGSVQASRKADNIALQSISRIVASAGLGGVATVAQPLAAVQSRWHPYDLALAQLATLPQSNLYVDTASGSQLGDAGRALRDAINEILARQQPAAAELGRQLTQLSGALQTAVAAMGAELRGLLMAGTLLAGLLIVLMLYFAMRARLSGAAARQAARQVESILASVREGLFLVDRQGRIGKAHSSSLAGLLHNPSPGGRTLQELLRPMVDESTQLAAGKFLNLLWNKRVNEDLIESVNPLQQIAVSVKGDSGGFETRYLSFAFHRAGDADEYLLGSVADVTDRVLLQQELSQLKAGAGSGGGSDLLMQLLKVDPLQLQVFLASATEAFQASNARLTAPGKDQPALREKLDGVFRDLHATKGEAAALGMESLARRIHAAEDILAALRRKSELAGSDFVAIVTHLDELLRHVTELAGAQAQLAAYNVHGQRIGPASRAPQAAAADAPQHQDDEAAVTHPTERLLRSLAVEVGQAMGREVRVSTEGLERVPAEHEARVKDICVQMVRNAIAHGIETPAARRAAGKPANGKIRVSFTEGGRGDYALVIEDDGQGLSYDRILARARQLSLVESSQVALDRGAVFKMIFMPGFSTAGEVSAHAGRGVGLDAVNSLVRECGGRIGIATVSGQFTRFRVLLPGAMQAAAAAEA